jgi:2-phosphosulfolactate phosphatase
MKLSVYFTPLGLTPAAVSGKPVIVLDILRATTTIVAALANGAKAVLPTASSDEALTVAQNIDRKDRLLTGERRCVRIEGFDLGNSPLEMTAEAVAGKTLIVATTNGTPALVAAETGRPVIVGAITNFTAAVKIAREAVDRQEEISIICSGKEKFFALEDAYVAGRYAQALLAGRSRAKNAHQLNDGAIAAIELVRRYGTDWKKPIMESAAARDLLALKFKPDVLAAVEVDRYDIVPVYKDRRITMLPRG